MNKHFMTKKEIIEALNNLATKIDSVDEPKQQPKYPEGIVSFRDLLGKIHTYNGFMKYQDWCSSFLNPYGGVNTLSPKIHSVKNSKGEVFTVGDEFECKPIFKDTRKIDSFSIVSGAEPYIVAYYEEIGSILHIDVLTKVEKQQPSWKDQIIAFRWNSEVYYRNVATFSFSRYDTFRGVRTLKEEEQTEIFTVKNKAGIEFSVGDKKDYREIYLFTIEKDCIIVHYRVSPNITGCMSLEDYVNAEAEPKPKEVLFTTHDGVDVYHMDSYYQCSENSAVLCNAHGTEGYGKCPSGLKFFKEEANAERFVAENKKSISYKELEDFLDKNYVGAGFLYEDIDSRRRFRTEILNKFKPQ